MNISTPHCRAAARVLSRSSIVALLCMASLTSCHRAPSVAAMPQRAAVPDDCIARVGDVTITREAFERQWQRQGQRPSKQEVLDQMIRSAVLLARAKAAGYDREPQVVARINEFIVARFQEDQLAKQGAGEPRVSPQEIETFYRANPARFTVSEAVRAAVLFVKLSRHASEEKKAERRQQAERLLAQARKLDDANFRRLVEQNSEDQGTRYIGGDTGWLQAGDTFVRWPGAVVQAAFAVSQVNGLAPLVTTADGFYLVRLTERRSAHVRPLEEVRGAIAYQIVEEKRSREQRAFFQQMQSGLEIEINAPLLESIPSRAQVREERPPLVPRS